MAHVSDGPQPMALVTAGAIRTGLESGTLLPAARLIRPPATLHSLVNSPPLLCHWLPCSPESLGGASQPSGLVSVQQSAAGPPAAEVLCRIDAQNDGLLLPCAKNIEPRFSRSTVEINPPESISIGPCKQAECHEPKLTSEQSSPGAPCQGSPWAQQLCLVAGPGGAGPWM